MKHKPGPWKARVGKRTFIGNLYVAEVSEQREADARLIAAAPDLLKALKAFDPGEALHVTHRGAMCRICAARAAIAKAEGKS